MTNAERQARYRRRRKEASAAAVSEGSGRDAVLAMQTKRNQAKHLGMSRTQWWQLRWLLNERHDLVDRIGKDIRTIGEAFRIARSERDGEPTLADKLMDAIYHHKQSHSTMTKHDVYAAFDVIVAAFGECEAVETLDASDTTPCDVEPT
jgi:hypothetical protein